ncbi:AAA family ATPase [Fusobacterium sp. PH5-44]|uniref:AAA family ATPase n=1 Tax=unclassified Fusobacterium TaxID=2648384 RepID=UPI003D197541
MRMLMKNPKIYAVVEDIINIASAQKRISYELIKEKLNNFAIPEEKIEELFLEIENQGIEVSERKYWLYSPGEGARHWDDNLEKCEMAVGWDFLGDFSEYTSKEEISKKIKLHKGKGENPTNDTKAIWDFVHELKIGDIVYAKSGITNIIGRGVIESDYLFCNNENEYKNRRKVKWKELKIGLDLTGQVKTLINISRKKEFISRIEDYFKTKTVKNIDIISSLEIYTKENFLEEVYMNEESYDLLKNTLLNKKNIILQGAPGVGKTFAAKRLAYSIIGEKNRDRVNIIQFHQSYSYEDFIMGYKPVENGFKLSEGPFYEFCKRAQDNEDNPYFFIIDEINRGNLSKIFGELLMLIENDKRGEKLRLMYRNENFAVPPNVHIIGMMNTADRGLALIDYALRRRFAFFQLEPAFECDTFKMVIESSDNPKFSHLIDVVKKINNEISEDSSLGDGFKIGHSYFCNGDNVSLTDEWLSAVIKFEIIPLLNEYWFDDQEKVKKWSDSLYGVLNG